MLQLCLAQKIDGTNRPVYVTSPLLSPKGVSVKRGVRAGVGVRVSNPNPNPRPRVLLTPKIHL